MGILSIMHKLHDPFNSCCPSDPNRNSPSLLRRSSFSPPRKAMRVLPSTSSYRTSPSPRLKFSKQRNSNSAMLPVLQLHADNMEKQRRIRRPLYLYCQSSAQTATCAIYNVHDIQRARRSGLAQFNCYRFYESFLIFCFHTMVPCAIPPIRIDNARRESPVRHGLCDLVVF